MSTAFAATRTTTRTACPFTERFDRRPPRGFAEESAGLSWRELIDTYAPSTHHFHLADLSRRPLGRGITAYEAILATPDSGQDTVTAHRLSTESCGDLTAMSEMLGSIGARVEIEAFHQYEGDPWDGTDATRTRCTILRATCGRRSTWALGFGEDSASSSIAALLSAATLLHLR